MKRTLVITAFFIVFIIIYILQTNFFSWYNIAGIKPNLFIILTLFIGLFLGKKIGFSLGAVFGFLLDLFISKRIGINATMLAIAGLMGGILDKGFSKESRITFMGMTFVVTILCEIINYALQTIMLNSESTVTVFIKIVMIEAIYNVILVIILYPLIKNAGIKTEEVFNKRKRILMRYY